MASTMAARSQRALTRQLRGALPLSSPLAQRAEQKTLSFLALSPVQEYSRRGFSSSTAQFESQFGPPNPETVHPKGGSPLRGWNKVEPRREGNSRYRPPEDPQARANREEEKRRYDRTRRRLTVALVASPVAIYTTYVLYARLIEGNDKRLTLLKNPPPLPMTSSKDNEK